MAARRSGRSPGPSQSAGSGTPYPSSARDLLAVLGSAERKQRRQRPSEFIHGSGLVAPELADAAASEGGRYRGREASETLPDTGIGVRKAGAGRGSPTPRG
ncbi:hypothetical protein ABQE57_24750 [Mycolicibacterium elephantis]